MGRQIAIAAGVIIFCSVSWAQIFSPQKDLAFAQVAAGGGYETVLTVTNRGTTPYTGSVNLFRGQGQAWNPIVNGTTVVNGRVTINIPAGTTIVYRITGAAGVEAGFAYVKADDATVQTATMEGNLTYYVRSGTAVTDSVGVSPSSEFFFATIPFEDSATIALGLGNPGTTTANVKLTVFNETNGQAAVPQTITVAAKNHIAQFLNQFFSGLSIGKGRLEIESDLPIIGTALTMVSNQFSSLPLLPSQRTFSFSANFLSGGIGFTGDGALWADGLAMNGYLRITGTTPNLGAVVPETYFVYGSLQDRMARVMGYGRSTILMGNEFIVHAEFDGFSFSANNLSGSITMTNMACTNGSTGTIQLTRIN